MSSVQAVAGANLSIIIQFNDIVFTSASLLKFKYFNAINEVPSGEFILNDSNSDLVVTRSGDFGELFFVNNSDNNSAKAGALQFIIDEINQIYNSGSNTTYQIKWTAGNRNALTNKTRTFKGTSLESMLEICKVHKYLGVSTLSDVEFEKPSDSMKWMYIQDDMWEALTATVNHSYLKNDYLYWVYDDVNSYIKFSTFNLEYSLEDHHMFVFSESARTGTSEVKKTISEPNITVWAYGADVRSNILGRNRDKLFPNVSFSGVVDTKIEQAGIRNTCFSSILKSMGDNKQDDIKEIVGVEGETEVFGELKVRRHAPNNTHKMYSVSDIYRDYRISTYGKQITVKIHNSIGPPLGTTAVIVALANDRKVRTNGIDTTFSDKYILVNKYVEYYTVLPTTTAGIKPTGTAEAVTILTYVSQNYGSEGLSHVVNLSKQLSEVTS